MRSTFGQDETPDNNF